MGTVIALSRYPVKSVLGEPIEQAVFTKDGIPGDRGWAFVDVETGRVMSAKAVPGLLEARALLRPGGPVVELPDGTVLVPGSPEADAAASRWLGRAVRLARPAPQGRPVIQDEEGTFLGRPGPQFFDSGPVHLLTTGTLEHLRSIADADFDARRFRPNIVVETAAAEGVEQSWIGSTIAIGDASFEVTKACRRCVMVTAAQSELPKDKAVLATVARETENVVGVYARVLGEGVVSLGDAVTPVRPSLSS